MANLGKSLGGLLCLLVVPSIVWADASVDGFYRSDYVRAGALEGRGNEASRGVFDYSPSPTVQEAPLLLPEYQEPKLYQGRFTKSTRGVEAAEVIDRDELSKGTVLVPIQGE